MVDRLRREMERQRLTPTQLSKRAQVGRSFIYDILNGKASNPTTKKLRALADALEVSVPYLIEGICASRDLANNSEYIGVRALNGAARGGGEVFYLPRSFFAGKDLRSDVVYLYFMESDEMEPTVKTFETLVIERSKSGDFSAGVYAIKQDSAPIIRRLERFYEQDRSYYHVRPDNRNYATYNLPQEDLCIIGRVAWRFGAL